MGFNGLDGVILAAAVLTGVVGYRLGFVTRVVSWIGLTVGLVVGARMVPVAVGAMHSGGASTRYLFVAIALLAGCGFVGQALGFAVGGRLHHTIHARQARRADSVVGAAVGALGVLVVVWLVSPAMSVVPGWPAKAVRGSSIARAVEDAFPGAPDGSQALRRVVGERYPQVFDALRPAPTLGNPPPASGLSALTQARVARSTVKVKGRACSNIQEGSGFVVGPDLVVTNAHVVAGERTTVLERYDDGADVGATVVAFDPKRDLALLRAPGLDRPALPLGEPVTGMRGAVFGHPEGGPLTVAPFEVAQQVDATGTDIYDGARTERQVLFLSSDLHPGDSGGALVNPNGQVVGVAFAIAPDRPGVAYALAPSELGPVLGAAGTERVGTGSCVA